MRASAYSFNTGEVVGESLESWTGRPTWATEWEFYPQTIENVHFMSGSSALSYK